MGAATAWDIFIICVLLFVIFGRRLMPGIGRRLVQAAAGLGRTARGNKNADNPVTPTEQPSEDVDRSSSSPEGGGEAGREDNRAH